MHSSRTAVAALAILVVVSGWLVTGAGQTPVSQAGTLPLAPLGVRGEAVFPAFEGWGALKDGSNVLLVGYFNRNKEQTLDIPIGPNNRIEPGGPDYGQPTHFKTGRQYGVFAISVPKDFGTRKLTWTLVANNQASVVSFWLNPPYWIDFFKNASNDNKPPVIRFSRDGRTLTGPPENQAGLALTGAVNQPVPLSLWVSDHPAKVNSDAQPPPSAAGRGGLGRGGMNADIIVKWSKYRGPGEVVFADQRIELDTKKDETLIQEARTTATFAQPGEYWLLATINDESGDGGRGDQCCWTSAHIRVAIR